MSHVWSPIKTCFLGFVFACIWVNANPPQFKPLTVGEYTETTVKQVTYGIYHAPIEQVSLHWQDADGKAYGGLSILKKALERQHKEPILLMNAGIYSNNFQPAGLWIENSETLQQLNTNEGQGNFHLKPNGVFFIQDNKAQIISTDAYLKLSIQPQYAMQSGPMLIIDGHINSRFRKDIDSPYKRNGVCVTQEGALYFIMSIKQDAHWPNLYEFAHALQSFGCYQALYLDGSISDWYIKDIANTFHWHTFVGIIAVTSN